MALLVFRVDYPVKVDDVVLFGDLCAKKNQKQKFSENHFLALGTHMK